MHYVYHIPERLKIGVTDNLERRMKQHKWTGTYQVMEEHLDGWHAGDREWELQDQYGYPRDKFHYMVSVMNAPIAGRKGGRISKPTLTFEQRSAQAKVNTPARIKQWEDAVTNSRIKVECPHCKGIGSINVYKSIHFDNCDFKNGIPQEYLEIIKYDEEHSRNSTAKHFGYSRSKIKRIIDGCTRAAAA